MTDYARGYNDGKRIAAWRAARDARKQAPPPPAPAVLMCVHCATRGEGGPEKPAAYVYDGRSLCGEHFVDHLMEVEG